MTKAKRLRRLCDLRRTEEHYQAALLESARTELKRIDETLAQALDRMRGGRTLVNRGIETGEARDRVTGLEELACATRLSAVLNKRRRLAEENVRRIESQYSLKRAERCQVETLLRIELELELFAAQRRSQSSLDEWHRAMRFRAAKDPADNESASELTT